MAETYKQSFTNIATLTHGESFLYGNAMATLLDPAAAATKRNTRVNTERLIANLQLVQFPGFPRDEVDPGEFYPPAISHDNGNAFSQITVGGVEHYVMARRSIDGRDLSQTDQARLRVISGMCLFSGNAAYAIAPEGDRFSLTNPKTPITEKIAKLDIQENPTTYEIETLGRLTTFVNAFAQSAPGVDRLYIKIPKVEYYTYLQNAYANDFISAEQMMEWIEAVDARHTRLSIQFQQQALQGLEEDIEVVAIDPLARLEDYMKQIIEQNDQPDLEEAKSLLAVDTTWRLWGDLLAVEPPNSWGALNNLSYVLAELEAGSDASTATTMPHIGVVVKNSTESKVFAHGKRLVVTSESESLAERSGREFGLIALYPHEKLVYRTEDGRRPPYFAPELEGEHVAQDVEQAYSRVRSGLYT